MAAMSIGSGFLMVPSQVYLVSSTLIRLKSLISTTICNLPSASSLIFGSCLRDTNIALASEWTRMFSTSLGETSGSIGTAIRPKEVMAKKATPQLGWFSDRIAILSDALMPKVARTPESRSQASLKPA